MQLGYLCASIGDLGSYMVNCEIGKVKLVWTFQQLSASHTLKPHKNCMGDVSFNECL